MTKVYVTATCPDCSEVKKRLSGNPDFEIIDICEHVRNLKEFIRLRDSSPAFDSVRAGGSIGIPCFVEDDVTGINKYSEIGNVSAVKK
ncbi:MAG: glutaredoxin, partial [Candidatus Cryptobacteroides sp.]